MYRNSVAPTTVIAN